jgi:hypothetical protein
LYVCNDFADRDWFYRNVGKGSDGLVRFKNVIADVVPITTWSSMGADAADINNDGLLDLITGEMASTTHYGAMIKHCSHRLDLGREAGRLRQRRPSRRVHYQWSVAELH